MKSKTVHFSIDFNWLTNQVRTFWAEGEYKRAYDVLKCCNIEGEKANNIIRGKWKMVAVKDDPNKGTLVEDNWKPDLYYCQHSLYPDPNDILDMAKKSIQLKLEIEQNRIDQQKELVNKLGKAYKNEDWEEARQIWDIIDNMSEKDRKQLGEINWSKKLLEEVELNNGKIPDRKTHWEKNVKPNIPTVDNFVKQQLGLSDRPCPKPTKDFKKWNSGWVLPNGKFYPCRNAMEHIWLAGKLGKSEREAEDAGWVKCSYAMLGIYVISRIKPTQKQIDTVFDWMMAKESERKEAYDMWNDSWNLE